MNKHGKIAYALCALILLQFTIHAAQITVGSTRLDIPEPEGYSQVTPDIKPYADATARLVTPTNERFIFFISNEDFATAKKGGLPSAHCRYEIQVPKKIIGPVIPLSTFAEVKKTIKKQNADALKKAEAEMQDTLKKASDGLSKDYNSTTAAQSIQVRPMAPHDETEQSLAFSTLVRVKTADASGASKTTENVVTTTLVFVRGKVITLYVHADKPRLEWSKSASKKWTDLIIAENASAGAKPVRNTNVTATNIKSTAQPVQTTTRATQTPQMAMAWKKTPDTRNWVQQFQGGDKTRILLEFVPEGDDIKKWNEMLIQQIDFTTLPLAAYVNIWKIMLLKDDPNIIITESKQEDESYLMTFVSLTPTPETGERQIRRFIKGRDAVYQMAYSVRPTLKNDEIWNGWSKIISEAKLVPNPMQDAPKNAN